MSQCCKKTERSEEEKKQLLNRINRISGQVNGIYKENYKYDIAENRFAKKEKQKIRVL